MALAVVALTHPRARQDPGRPSPVPAAEQVAGQGATSVMAAFSQHRAAFLLHITDAAIGVDLRRAQADRIDTPHAR